MKTLRIFATERAMFTGPMKGRGKEMPQCSGVKLCNSICIRLLQHAHPMFTGLSCTMQNLPILQHRKLHRPSGGFSI